MKLCKSKIDRSTNIFPSFRCYLCAQSEEKLCVFIFIICLREKKRSVYPSYSVCENDDRIRDEEAAVGGGTFTYIVFWLEKKMSFRGHHNFRGVGVDFSCCGKKKFLGVGYIFLGWFFGLILINFEGGFEFFSLFFVLEKVMPILQWNQDLVLNYSSYNSHILQWNQA